MVCNKAIQTLAKNFIRHPSSKVDSLPCQQIIGLTGSGKTSLLNVFSLLGDSNYQSLFAETYGLSEDVVGRVVFAQVDCAAGFSAEKERDFWYLMVTKFIAAVEDIFPKDRFNYRIGATASAIDLREALVQLRGKGVLAVFLLDNFDKVASEFPIDISHNLRFLLDEFRNIDGVSLAFITANLRPIHEYYLQRPTVPSFEVPCLFLLPDISWRNGPSTS